MVKHIRFYAWVAIVTAVANVAHAQVDNAGVLDQALRRFREAAQGWQDASHSAATTLFWSLATISLVWTMGQLALKRAELGEFFGELVRYLLFTGFWAWMLQQGPTHAQMIMDSMVRIGGSAAGTTLKSPSGVLDVGFQLLDRALEQSSLQSPVETSIGIVMALGVVIVLALVGVNMLVTMISCWIVAYGGLIVLGFGGSKWTSDMASNYYRMVLSLGLQVLAMVLLVGVGEGLLRDYFGRLEQTVNVRELAVMMVIAIVLLLTVNRVPALLGTLANGSSPQYALGSGAGAGAALSTLSATSAMAAMASRPMMDGAQQLARAAAAGFATGGPGAAASLADSFRSGGSQDAASSGSVFAPPSMGGATPSGESGRAFGSSGGSGESGASATNEGRATVSENARASGDSGAEREGGSATDHEAADGKQSTPTAEVAATKAQPLGSEQPSEGSTGAGNDEDTSSADDAKRSDASRRASNDPASDGAPTSSAASNASDVGSQAKGSSATSGADMLTGAKAVGDSGGKTTSLDTGAGGAERSANASGTGPVAGQASSTPTPPPLSSTSIAPAPTGSIASATQMQIQVQPGSDERFQSLAPAPPPIGAFQSPRPATAALPLTPGAAPAPRNDLVAASLAQTNVDIEAEVAAFRDLEG